MSGFLSGYLAMGEGRRAEDDAKMRQKLNEAMLLEHQAGLEEIQRQKQVRQMKQQFAQQIPSMGEGEGMDKLADLLISSGEVDEGLRLKEQAALSQDRAFQRKKAKRDEFNGILQAASDMAAGVDSQEAADEFVAWAKSDPANMGVVPKWLPPVYNEQTKPRWDRFAKMTMSAAQRETLLKTQAEIDHKKVLEDQATKREQRMEDQAAQARLEAERRDARFQSQMENAQTRTDIALGGLELNQAKEQRIADEKAHKLNKEKTTDRSGATEVVEAMDQSIEKVEELVNHPGLKNITGWAAGRTPTISQDGQNAQALLDVLKNKVFVGMIQTLRNTSQTGSSGLGSITEKEGDRLENALVALKQSQDTDTFKGQLKDLIKEWKRVQRNIRRTYKDTYDEDLVEIRGTLSAGELAEYAKKHNTTEAEARKFLTAQGYKVAN